MSGAGLIEMLAARLGGRGMRRSAPALREVLASAMPNRAPVTAYEPIASRLDDPMAEGAMLSGTNDVSTPMPNAIRTGPDAGPVRGGINPVVPPPPEGARRLFNASTVDHDPNGYLDPHVSGWVEEVANGAGDFDNIGDITRPLVYMSDNPESWVRMIVGRKIGKHPNDVTIEDIRAHGRLNIVDADPEYDNIFQVGEHSADDSVTTLGGERRRMWETNLYDSEDFREMPVGPEPDDFISREPVQVAHSLTGDDLVRFLEQNSSRTAPDGGPVQAGRTPLGRGRSKTVYDDPADPARVIVEMPPDPVTEAFLQFSRDAHARGLPFARHLPNPDAVESVGNVVRYRTERLAPNDTRARVGRENGGFFITGVDNAEQSGSIIAAMNALDDHLRRTLPPNTPRHFYDLGPQNFMRRADGTLVINDPVESTGFAPRTGPNAGSDRNALQRALRERMERE